jgi:UDP-N-acetylmuramoylalanine--D-glutamate ligase
MSYKHMLIIGGGESGTGAAVLANTLGYDVFVSDSNQIKEQYKNILKEKHIRFEEGQHTMCKTNMVDVIVKSPGIPDTAPIIKHFTNKQIPILSEIEFAFQHTDAHIIAITGSNGKTTTALLTYHILQNAGFKVGLAGNVGTSFALQVANNQFDYYVLEVSSFQLDNCYQFAPDIAVLLNITPDHLDRYEFSMHNYVNSKFRITQNLNQSQHFVYCADDLNILNVLKTKKIKGTHIPFSINKELDPTWSAYIKENEMKVNTNNKSYTMLIEELALQGKHNAHNSMAAAISARVLDIKSNILKESLSDFVNAEHRLEFVAKVHGVEFINDSKATNVNSAWYALETYNKKIVWIAGGQDKGNDYGMLAELVKERVKAIVCLGVDNTKLKRSFKGLTEHIVESNNMSEAVQLSFKLSSPGDVVLLSPSCASFDLFEDYEDRGNQFKKAVVNL